MTSMSQQLATIGLGIGLTGLIWLLAVVCRPLPRIEDIAQNDRVELNTVRLGATLIFVSAVMIVLSMHIDPLFNR